MPALTISVDYIWGDIVYLKTDPEQLQRIVWSFDILQNGTIVYNLACGVDSSKHYSFEISDVRGEVYEDS